MSSPLSSVLSDFEDDGPSTIRITKSATTSPMSVKESQSANIAEKAEEASDKLGDGTLNNFGHSTHQNSQTASAELLNHDIIDVAHDTSARSPRKRKPAIRYGDDIETPTKTQTATKKSFSGTNKAITTITKRQPLRGNWSPGFLLSNPKSKIATCNLVTVLNNDRAWTSLSRTQQIYLISSLPGASIPHDLPADIPLPNILASALKSNLSLQADIRLFQEDLAAGRYEPQWLIDAQSAMAKRAAGVFDIWKEKNREEFWGQKQKIDWYALAGESSEHSLPLLVGAGCFKVGDIWRLRRSWRKEGHKTNPIVVEKEATITAISDINLLTFAIPRGQYLLSSPANGIDIVVADIDGPTALSNAILKEDGRIVGQRAANAWKEFRISRNNQDIGSLFDVRELYHQRIQKEKERS